MEGSPARGQKLDALAAVMIDLNEASTLQEFHRQLVDQLSDVFRNITPFVVLRRPDTKSLDFEATRFPENDSPIAPSSLKADLERHSELLRKLIQGEMVGIT